MIKKHGLSGKPSNHTKNDEDRKESTIQIRCLRRLKSGAVKTANDDGKTLSAWIVDLINKNVRY